MKICQICQQPIEYVYGWRHRDGEAADFHKPQPKEPEYQPCWPVLVADELVMLLDNDKPVRFEQW